MANRFPLVVDTDDGNKLKELPAGDQLDLANSGIANLTNLSVGGNINSQTLTTVGNTTLGGNLSVSGTLTVDGDSIGVQVQSDWAETNPGDPAFIRNKPDIGGGSETLAGLTDTSISNPQNDEVLLYFNNQWVNAPAPDSGSNRTDAQIRALIYQLPNGIDVIDQPPSGQGLIEFGNDPGEPNEYGKIIYTPPALPTSTSDLINDGDGDPDNPSGVYVGVNNLGIDDLGNKYLKSNDIIGFGRLTSTVVNGQVQIVFDESGLLTVESDTLETVTGRGATTSLAIEADAFNQAAASTSTSTIKFIEAETIDILTSLTATNANFTTTNGSITATNGAVSGNNGSFSNQLDGGNMRLSVNSLSNTAGNNVEINGGSAKVDIQGNGLNMPSSGTLPTTPTEGDVFFSNNALYMYVGDDGSGAPDWVLIGGPGNASGNYGMQLPAFESPDRPSGIATEGVLIYNLTDSVVQVWNGTTWANL